MNIKIKLLFGLLLCSASLTSFAQEVSPLKVKEQLVTNAFTYINQVWADQGRSLSRKTTQKYFTPDTTLIINGRKVYTGYTGFTDHFQQVGKSIRGKIHLPLQEIMGVDNKLIVRFNEDIYDHQGNYYPTTVMAIFTLRENKIQQWDEVVYSKYFCQPEAESVVYSNK